MLPVLKMNNKTMVLCIIVGLLLCISLFVLGYKLIHERYTTLREIGSTLQNQRILRHSPVHKKFLRHKYSRGSAYDRIKLRTNPFQKNYAYSQT
jgi:hypothetical protein